MLGGHGAWNMCTGFRPQGVQAEDHLGRLPPGRLTAGGYEPGARSVPWQLASFAAG